MELGAWIKDMRKRKRRNADANGGQSCLPLTAVPQADALPASTPLFTVPAALVKILDRDLKLAGIAKRDELGRSVDVHALRHCFGTLLSRSGVAPRTAQAAMRHSTIDLTMNVYTDPKLLDVHQAVESLPHLSLVSPEQANRNRATGTFGASSQFAPGFAPSVANSGKSLPIAVNSATESDAEHPRVREGKSASPVEKNNPLSIDFERLQSRVANGT